MTVVLRCDASPAIGFGHLFRSLALAREFADRDVAVRFAIAEGPDAAALVEREGYQVLLGDGWLSMLGVDVLVLDVRDGTPLSSIDDIRARGVLVATIDDPTERRLSADLVFYPPIPEVDEFGWRGFSGTRLAGGEWVVLRRAFAEPPVRADRERPTVLVTMGGSDPGGMTLTAVRGLSEMTATFDLAIVIGPGYGDRERLDGCLRRFGRPAAVYEEPEDMRAVMLGADLAVASFGVTAYELAATATPAAYLCYTEDHARSASALVTQGAAVSLGVHTGDEAARVAQTVAALLADRDRRNAMGRAGRALVDGRGAARVAERIISEVAARDARRTPGQPIT